MKSEAADVIGPVGKGSREQGNPFLQPCEAIAADVSLRQGQSPGIRHAHFELVTLTEHLDFGLCPRGVLERVRQGLLHDPVDGELEGRGQTGRVFDLECHW